MRKNLLIILIGSLFCTGYSPWQPSDAAALRGTWRYVDNRAGKLQLAFNEDYSYYVDFNGDGRADIQGVYEFWDQRLIFRDEIPDNNTDCVAPGVYHFKIDNGRLSFQQYSDDCRPRSAVLRQTFTRHGMIRGL